MTTWLHRSLTCLKMSCRTKEAPETQRVMGLTMIKKKMAVVLTYLGQIKVLKVKLWWAAACQTGKWAQANNRPWKVQPANLGVITSASRALGALKTLRKKEQTSWRRKSRILSKTTKTSTLMSLRPNCVTRTTTVTNSYSTRCTLLTSTTVTSVSPRC